MDERAQMQEQMAAIGDRYLRRTLGELARLHELLDQLRSGAPEARKAIEAITHRIHGSGAMFGFDEVSELAYRCEILCADDAVDAQLAAKLEACLHALETSLVGAARARGIEA
jgi:HPt (histidine-containing phosphotransfer) domain-containing protein